MEHEFRTEEIPDRSNKGTMHEMLIGFRGRGAQNAARLAVDTIPEKDINSLEPIIEE